MRNALIVGLSAFLLISMVSCQAQQEVPYDSLRETLERIYDSDQGVRQNIGSVKPEKIKALLKKMDLVDSINQKKVLVILQKYGWLPQSKIGEKAADALFLVVQHAPVPVIKKYFPAMQAMAEKGEANTSSAAMMHDRLLMYQGKKQIYGTQATSNLTQEGSLVIWPVKDPKTVNQRRKEAGFADTVEENAARLGAKYHPNEELPPQKIESN